MSLRDRNVGPVPGVLINGRTACQREVGKEPKIKEDHIRKKVIVPSWYRSLPPKPRSLPRVRPRGRVGWGMLNRPLSRRGSGTPTFPIRKMSVAVSLPRLTVKGLGHPGHPTPERGREMPNLTVVGCRDVDASRQRARWLTLRKSNRKGR
jgi:hypothetical protein